MNEAGRILIEFLLGILLAAGVLALAPSHIRALRELFSLHSLSEREASCIRELAGALLLNDPASDLPADLPAAVPLPAAGCERLVDFSCETPQRAVSSCRFSLRSRPSRKVLEMLRLTFGGA